MLNTVAGTGAPGFGGDDGPAIGASFNFATPTGLALDPAGNLYISVTANGRVRKVSGGTITTIAGNGTPGFRGDGSVATSAQLDYLGGLAVDTAGNVYVADVGSNRVRLLAPGTSQDQSEWDRPYL